MSDNNVIKLNSPFDKNKKIVAVLGFFDALHIGHKKVICSAKELAKKLGAKTLVISFDGNLKGALNGSDKCVYGKEQREKLILNAGADGVCFAPLTYAFLSLEPTDFLDLINDSFNVVGYCFGYDYRFGKNAIGNAQFLRRYANDKNQETVCVEQAEYKNEKVSAKRIKKLLETGDVRSANEMLTEKYSVSGKVFEDRKIGTKIGFPTVNIEIDKDLHHLKDGVYAGSITLEGKEYKTMINYGARPTFDLQSKLCEAHIIGYDGLLYGKEIKLYFDYYLRDIKKFDTVEELIKQLTEDLLSIKESK